MDAKDFGNRLIACRWAQNEVADLKRLGVEYVTRDDKRHEAIFARRRQRTVIFQDTRTEHWTEHPYPQVNPRHWAYDLIQAALDR